MADASATAGSVMKGIAPVANAIPYVGGLVSMGLTMGGGALEMSAAKKQQEQAAKLRNETDAMQPGRLQDEYFQKYRGDKSLALAGLPGIDLYKDWLAESMAGNMRAIKENSANGAQAVNAISLALGNQNAAINKLGVDDAAYRAKYNEAALADLWNIGDKKQSLADMLMERQKLGYAQANNLEAAATGNKQTGLNHILGAVGSTAVELTKNFQNDMWASNMQQPMTSGTTPYPSGETLTNFNPSEYSSWNYQPNFSPSYTTPPQ